MRPELLCPAGNAEKLRAAIRYGADAVYLSGEFFGMRAAAHNFTVPAMAEAVAYAHAHGVRVYLTVNTMPREDEYPALCSYFSRLAALGCSRPDALIVADLGVLALARQMLPDMDLHISTQANVTSAAAVRAYAALGAKRVVLARELSLNEIRAIRGAVAPQIELEAFIHGSMCISYSGRCLLSSHLVGRDANRGMCAQPCRWNYTLRTEIVGQKHSDAPLPVEQCRGETFIMASRDTCMIEHIPELMESGVSSFKIEGRMKSAYYTAVCANTYRMAMDAYGSGSYIFDPRWREELESVSHRAYGTGYYFSDSRTDANLAPDGGNLSERAFLAEVLSYDSHSGVARLSQRNKVVAGQAAQLLTPGSVGISLTVLDLYDAQGVPVASAPHPRMEFSARLSHPVKPGDMLRAAH